MVTQWTKGWINKTIPSNRIIAQGANRNSKQRDDNVMAM
jgi:hypothetical protein